MCVKQYLIMFTRRIFWSFTTQRWVDNMQSRAFDQFFVPYEICSFNLKHIFTLSSQITVKNYEEPKIKAIEIAALLQEKYAFLTGESKSPNFL